MKQLITLALLAFSCLFLNAQPICEPPSGCNYLWNGGFEGTHNSCWQTYISSPDYFSTANNATSTAGVPLNFGIPNNYTSLNTYNGLPVNNRMLGLWGYRGIDEEAVYSNIGSGSFNILPNSVNKLKMHVNINKTNATHVGTKVKLRVFLYISNIALLPNTGLFSGILDFDLIAKTCATNTSAYFFEIPVPNISGSGWQTIEVPFTYTGASNPSANPTQNNTASPNAILIVNEGIHPGPDANVPTYIVIDDVNIAPDNNATPLSIIGPNEACSTVPNLYTASTSASGLLCSNCYYWSVSSPYTIATSNPTFDNNLIDFGSSNSAGTISVSYYGPYGEVCEATKSISVCQPCTVSVSGPPITCIDNPSYSGAVINATLNNNIPIGSMTWTSFTANNLTLNPTVFVNTNSSVTSITQNNHLNDVIKCTYTEPNSVKTCFAELSVQGCLCPPDNPGCGTSLLTSPTSDQKSKTAQQNNNIKKEKD
jgi:hypothetical protein